MRVFFFLFIIIIYIYSDTIEGYFSCIKTNVANSDKASGINKATKDTQVTVKCNTGHKGGGPWKCNAPTGLNTSYKWSKIANKSCYRDSLDVCKKADGTAAGSDKTKCN